MAAQLKDEASIELIINEMTREEKASLVTGETIFYTRTLEKYGIPGMFMLDGGTGINTTALAYEKIFQEYIEKLKKNGEELDVDSCGILGGMQTIVNNGELMNKFMKWYAQSISDPEALGCYPAGMAFGATWNPEVIAACGHTLAREINAAGIDVLLGSPNAEVCRDPLNGRLFEAYSEDPCLIAGLVPAFVTAVQEEGVIANSKHFAANNQETERIGVNEIISERALREIYLPGFKATVEAGCGTIMTAYNSINGVPCAQNRRLLHDILRDEWGFDGFVMSDWSAAYDQAAACDAGNDLVMPGPRSTKPILDALEDGSLKEERLDECVRNILKIVLKSIAFKGGRRQDYDVDEGIKAAYNAAAESITLLKNDGALPLPSDAKPALYGKYSKKMLACGGGSAEVLTSLRTEIYDCAQETFGAENVTFEEVTDDTTVVIATVGSNGREGADREEMLMDADDRAALDRAAADAKEKNIPLIVLMNIAGPIEIYDWEQDASAILCLYIPGMQGGRAAVDVLTGKVNPSGKLPLTFPKKYRDCPTYGNFPGYNYEVIYGEGIYVGYRYYEIKNIDVMYPFGYGLSYTTFEITGADAPASMHPDEEDLTVHVRVKNTGNRAGSETVQLYVGDVKSTLDKPLKELKAFKKVRLLPGEEKELCLVLKKQDFASYDTMLKEWAVEPGEFRLYIGNASNNISIVLDLDVICDNPYGLGPVTDITTIVSDKEIAAVVNNATGLDIKEVTGSYILSKPLTPFFKVWDECVLPLLDTDGESAENIKKKIYKEWKAIDKGEDRKVPENIYSAWE